MKVLIASAEMHPIVKVGGLADVIGALGKYLNLYEEIEASIIIPYYKYIEKFFTDHNIKLKEIGEIWVPLKNNNEKIIIYNFEYDFISSKCNIFLVKHDLFYCREGIYTNPENGKGYEDNGIRYTLFSRSVLEMIDKFNLDFDIIHTNDSHTALINVYLKTFYKNNPKLSKIKTLLSIHNISYQGIEYPEILEYMGFGYDVFYPGSPFEYWGKINFMKLGIIFADIINTVSKTYAHEIQMYNEYGFGLEGVLLDRTEDIYGIINGIDYDEWNPETDKFIDHHFSINDLSGKLVMKKYLLKKCNLKDDIDKPLISIISRLTDQKGFDLIAEIFDQIMQLDLNLIILGTGEEKYHKIFSELSDKYKDKFSLHLKFDNKLAHELEAGSDIFLMPSKFEPCGLNQLYSLRYGTVPIVRKTGGLADTIENVNPENGTGTGFVFNHYNSFELLETIKLAVNTYNNKNLWNKIIKNGMEKDFSWKKTINEYINLYKILINK